MARYIFTSDAKSDFMEIRKFTIKYWGAEQSARYLSALKKTFSLLAEMPSMGKSNFEPPNDDIYQFPSGSHVIHYIIMSAEKINIIAILHQNMMPAKHLNERLS